MSLPFKYLPEWLLSFGVSQEIFNSYYGDPDTLQSAVYSYFFLNNPKLTINLSFADNSSVGQVLQTPFEGFDPLTDQSPKMRVFSNAAPGQRPFIYIDNFFQTDFLQIYFRLSILMTDNGIYKTDVLLECYNTGEIILSATKSLNESSIPSGDAVQSGTIQILGTEIPVYLNSVYSPAVTKWSIVYDDNGSDSYYLPEQFA